MTRDTMEDIISKHNAVVTFIGGLDDVKIPMEALLRLMPLADRMSALGLALTQEARAMGLDVKCNMQSGEII